MNVLRLYTNYHINFHNVFMIMACYGPTSFTFDRVTWIIMVDLVISFVIHSRASR